MKTNVIFYRQVTHQNTCGLKVWEQVIWESAKERLLGLVLDKELNFDKHLMILCKNVSAKVTALARMAKIIPFEK